MFFPSIGLHFFRKGNIVGNSLSLSRKIPCFNLTNHIPPYSLIFKNMMSFKYLAFLNNLVLKENQSVNNIWYSNWTHKQTIAGGALLALLPKPFFVQKEIKGIPKSNIMLSVNIDQWKRILFFLCHFLLI